MSTSGRRPLLPLALTALGVLSLIIDSLVLSGHPRSAFFKLPPERVVELGVQVEM